MNLGDLFKRLSYGPFSNIALGGDGNGTILVGKQPAVVQHINDALIQLHSRFILVEKELVITQVEGQTLYPLTDEATDVLKVMSVSNINGVELPLNEDGEPDSVFTPDLQTLQVPTPINDAPLFVIYQAKPAPLSIDPINTGATIAVPDVLLPALTHYVAYLVYSGMNGQEHQVIAQNHLTMYDNQCVQVIERDLVSSSIVVNDNNKLHDRGFV